MYKCTECNATADAQTDVCPGCGKTGMMVAADAAPEAPASDESVDSEDSVS